MPISSSPWIVDLLRDLAAMQSRSVSVSLVLRYGKVTWNGRRWVR